MNKINFENLPGTNTPINATNMNLLQDNIEDGIEDGINDIKAQVLYYDDTASYTSATLTYSITNYDIIVVIGQSTDGYQCSTTIYRPAINHKISLEATRVYDGTVYNKQAVYNFSSNNIIESVENYQLTNGSNPVSGVYIKLKAVLGYKL